MEMDRLKFVKPPKNFKMKIYGFDPDQREAHNHTKSLFLFLQFLS